VLKSYWASSLADGSRWDYIGWETKVAILQELSNIIYSESCTKMVVNSPGFPYIGEMLESPDPLARQSSCLLLHKLTQYECTIPPIVGMRGCERLVALIECVWYIFSFFLFFPDVDFPFMQISDRNNQVVWEATDVLLQIAQFSDGAQAVVDARVQDHILKLLKSRSSEFASWTCPLVVELAGHELTAPAILGLNLLKQLIFLSR
jgi:hypothetical protein